jgi:hypothetical protein
MNAITTLEGISLKGTEDLPWAHAPGCRCKPEETFTCAHCGRRVGYCLGGFDNMPEACNFCWKPEEEGVAHGQ